MKEPEEIIEAKLIALLQASVTSMDVLGALSPFADGEQKLSPDTYIAVFVDVASQLIDWRGAAPMEYSARITVHFARADDANGSAFRDACREVRSVLGDLAGDGCASMTSDGFACDAFVLNSTSTSPDADAAGGGMAKTYNATITGRYHQPQQQES